MKALVVDFNFVGDILMSSPIYRALDEHSYTVDSLGYDFCREALEANPYIHEIHTTGRSLNSKVQAMLKARGKYDLVLQLNTSLKTNLLMTLTGAHTLGYSYGLKGLPLHTPISIKHRTCTVGNRRDEVLGLLERAFGWEIPHRDMIFVPEKRGEVDPSLIAIHANTKNTRDLRRWTKTGYAQVCKELKDYRVVFTGTAEDRRYIDYVKPDDCPNYGVDSSLQDFASFLTKCRLLITVNTMTMHLGIALGVPTVALIGGTPASVCVGPETERLRYVESMDMTKITPEMVMRKVNELL